MNKFYIIAGESSGDLHASNLMKALFNENANCDFRFWGGDQMLTVSQKTGGTCVKHIRELAFMGFTEVAKNLRTILRNMQFCKNDILKYKPDALILIDYPGFNLRIAEWAKKRNIKVIYYISPQVWAWKKNRVYKIKKVVDAMYVILPFEQEFYKRFGVEVTYVGHPLLDAIQNYQAKRVSRQLFVENKLDKAPIIALLPGSRKQEVKKKLPIMLAATQKFKNYQIIVAGSSNLEPEFYETFLKKHTHAKIVYGQTYDLLSETEAAVVTSGTATLETALFEVPEVVCYIGSPISYIIARWLIKINYISLVNLIVGKEIVRELIQADCTAENIAQELEKLLKGGAKREAMLENYRELKHLLGSGGASEKMAKNVVKLIIAHA